MSSKKFPKRKIILVLTKRLVYNWYKLTFRQERRNMSDKLKETTSKRIKELRLSHNLTMEVLAEKLGVSKSTIAKWENGYVEILRQDYS